VASAAAFSTLTSSTLDSDSFLGVSSLIGAGTTAGSETGADGVALATPAAAYGASSGKATAA